ncbi:MULTISPECIES: hypothetical protein [Bradyrhizobium]|nr:MULTISPECIES: hypothetical protein [Bradyrhizobium]QOG18985.1 hypothetical protein FOM02_18200 [Bradyrhizobium sp. SEMIA]UFW45202.1 hypothetical protein BaraCB756_22970 [Bradyrhizobium arachidis]SFV00584.1 hypothetical protein SAMN05192541_109235 [Bradyrhizobium arachidis]
MKISLTMLLVVWSAAVTAQTAAPPQSDLSVRDQIKAARAKDKADEEADQTKRAWDRNGDGRRPWETSVAPERKPKP